MVARNIKICFSLILFLAGSGASADSFTDMLQNLAVQTACLGQYSSTEAGGSWEDDLHDYYTPQMMAGRFKEMSGERTRIETFYGIYFDYANCAYGYIEKYRNKYNYAGMYGAQFWIAISADDPNVIELSNPVTPEEGVRKWNGVPVKTYDTSYVSVTNHGNVTYHAWLWGQRNDGVLFWVDPTWTDNSGYVVYGYVEGGREIQCRPDEGFCVNYPYEILNQLPYPFKTIKKPPIS